MNDNTAPGSEVTVLPIEDSKATRLFKLMNRLAADEMKRYKREQVFYFPFFVTDDQLKEFSKDIIKSLEAVPSIEIVEFTGIVHFDDLSSQRFDNFEQFLDRAGKRKDPRSVKLSWNKFAIDSNGEVVSGQAELIFITEKRIKTGRDNDNDKPKAKIEVVVSGSDQRWVDQLFDDLIPMVNATSHGGIMRPLWIFQKTWFVQLISGFIGLSILLLLFNFGSAHVDFDNKKDLLKAYNNAQGIEKKLDIYVRWSISGREAHIVPFIISMAVVFAISLFVFFQLVIYIPYLTPSSAVAIGNAKRRALSTIDVFKFIIFTIIISGVILPLLRSGFSALWSTFVR